MTSFHKVYPNTFAPSNGVSELDTSEWRWTQWLGADSVAMVQRPDGAILIFCGDTYTTSEPNGYAFPADSFTNNSLLYWIGGRYGVKYSSGTNLFGSPNPYFPSFLSPSPGGFRWGQGAWIDVGTDSKVHVMVTDYEGTIFTGYTPINLREYIVNDDLTIASSAAVPGLAPQTVGGNLVTWGHAVQVDFEAGYTYIFGTMRVTNDGYRLVVCRRGIASGSLPANTPYFWTGSTWDSDMQNVTSLGPTTGNSLSVIRHPAGGWLCTSCRKGLLTNDIGAWYATTPNGTWTDLGDIYEIASEFTDQYNYGGLSYITSNNKLRLMYSLNSTDIDEIKADYRRYGIRWVEVDIPAAP
jgi:hypothetical protein